VLDEGCLHVVTLSRARVRRDDIDRLAERTETHDERVLMR
jgi:hypothetical protein